MIGSILLKHNIIRIPKLQTLLNIHTSNNLRMAKSRFEYVKSFELEDKLLLNVWIVVRIDGKGFHRLIYANNSNKL